MQDDIAIRLLQNDFVRGRVEISRFYRQRIKNARHSLVIVASYFLPGNRMRYLIRKASQRGVSITLLLSGKSDVGLMKQATNFLYPFLLRNGVAVYEWQPSVMHGKLMIVDEQEVTIGSYNMNTLSDYGSLELNIGVTDKPFSQAVKQRIFSLLDEGCIRIGQADYARQHYWWNQVINWISYQLMRTSLKILFLFMRK
jgi:cardiolipin synthase